MDIEATKCILTENEQVDLRRYLFKLKWFLDGLDGSLRPNYMLSKSFVDGMSSDLYSWLNLNVMYALETNAPYLKQENVFNPKIDYDVVEDMVKQEVNYSMEDIVNTYVKDRVAKETQRIKEEFVTIIKQLIDDDVLIPSGRWSENTAV